MKWIFFILSCVFSVYADQSLQELLKNGSVNLKHKNELNLSNKGLTDLIDLTHVRVKDAEGKEYILKDYPLEILDISHNNLAQLPTQLDKLTHLKILKINNNKLKEIPLSLFGSLNLEELDASHNELTELIGVDFLENLRILNINNNKIAVFPEQIFSLTQLEELYIANNILKMLPSGLLNMPKLKFVFAYNDKLDKNSRDILTKLAEQSTMNVEELKSRFVEFQSNMALLESKSNIWKKGL